MDNKEVKKIVKSKTTTQFDENSTKSQQQQFADMNLIIQNKDEIIKNQNLKIDKLNNNLEELKKQLNELNLKKSLTQLKNQEIDLETFRAMEREYKKLQNQVKLIKLVLYDFITF